MYTMRRRSRKLTWAGSWSRSGSGPWSLTGSRASPSLAWSKSGVQSKLESSSGSEAWPWSGELLSCNQDYINCD